MYRASHVLEDLGWVDLDLESSPRYCSYLLPMQDGGTSQIQVIKTQSTKTWDALYSIVDVLFIFPFPTFPLLVGLINLGQITSRRHFYPSTGRFDHTTELLPMRFNTRG